MIYQELSGSQPFQFGVLLIILVSTFAIVFDLLVCIITYNFVASCRVIYEQMVYGQHTRVRANEGDGA